MKFTIANLLALTAIAGLSLALLSSEPQAAALRRERKMLIIQNATIRNRAAAVKPILQVCEPAPPYASNWSKTLNAAQEISDKTRAKYWESDFARRSDIAKFWRVDLRSVPVDYRRKVREFNADVNLPWDESFELVIQASRVKEFLDESDFDFVGRVYLGLPARVSDLKFEWNENRQPATLTVTVDEKVVFSTTFRPTTDGAHCTWLSGRVETIGKSQKALSLLELTPKSPTSSHSLRAFLLRRSE